MNVKSTSTTLNKLISLLKKNEAFCYTRFGDSQLMVMAGWEGQDWEQVSSPKLELLQQKAFSVNDPDYLIAPSCGYEIEPGMKSGTFAPYRNDKEMVSTAETYGTTSTYWHCEAIHYGMLYNQKKVKELFKLINKRKVLTIAGNELDPRKWFPGAFIGIPMANAFKDYERYMERIYRLNPELVLLSCGLTSQIIQYFMFLDKPTITTINMGSVFNALLGVTEGKHTRGWIKDNKEVLAQFVQSL